MNLWTNKLAYLFIYLFVCLFICLFIYLIFMQDDQLTYYGDLNIK